MCASARQVLSPRQEAVSSLWGAQAVGQMGPWSRPLMALLVPHQIGQAIEEVSSNNQELLRKYRRELQLRKKCHNELVRLKGDPPLGAGERPAWSPRPGS